MIVSGLPEVDDADDTELFTSICENHLSCKPVVLKCRRMGKKSAGKPRRLLIHLRNESAAQDLLKSARRDFDSLLTLQWPNIYTSTKTCLLKLLSWLSRPDSADDNNVVLPL